MSNKICVYAICKNESKFIDKWLDNMSEADYIVVMDTGSADDTVERLQNDPRVTKVVSKEINPWRFDVARNESMKLIPDDANILVCTDFDELFDPGWAQVVRDNWVEGKTTRMFYKYAWSHTELGEPTDIFMYDKIHTRDYHWIFPVHEVLEINESCKQDGVRLDDRVFLHHHRDTSKDRKSYMDLLKVSAEENPTNPHVHMLLAREYLIKGENETSLEHYLKVLKMPEVDEPINKPILLESLGRCADLYYVLENYDEALWYAQEFIKEDPTYREPYFTMATVYNTMKMYSLAKSCIWAADTYATQKYNWIERASTWTNLRDDILSISEYGEGKYEEAVKHVNAALSHAPTDQRLLKNKIGFLEALVNETKKKAGIN